jgi:hypothetical protein
MKIRPVGAEMVHADGQTDRHNEANSRFSQFSERTQKRGINLVSDGAYSSTR